MAVDATHTTTAPPPRGWAGGILARRVRAGAVAALGVRCAACSMGRGAWRPPHLAAQAEAVGSVLAGAQPLDRLPVGVAPGGTWRGAGARAVFGGGVGEVGASFARARERAGRVAGGL
eukprot:5104794-Prymnesium_polylepis.1